MYPSRTVLDSDLELRLVVYPSFLKLYLVFYTGFYTTCTLLVVSTPRNCRHVDGMMSVYGYICLILVAIQTMLITAQRPTRYTRDQLLPLRASATLPMISV